MNERKNIGVQVQKVIEQLGYTAKEAKVYLATLSLGEAHISDVAQKTKMPRSSAQAIMEKLRREGLVNFYVQRRYKYWVAEDPQRILENHSKKAEAMREALPHLSAMRKEKRKPGSTKDAQSFEALRLLADSSAQPVLITDDTPAIMYVNAAWEETFGYAFDDVVGENPRMLQSGKTPREVYAKMWKALKAAKLFQSDEIIDRRKDGSHFNLLTTILPIERAGKRFYIQILDDITSRKRAEALGKQFLSA